MPKWNHNWMDDDDDANYIKVERIIHPRNYEDEPPPKVKKPSKKHTPRLDKE